MFDVWVFRHSSTISNYFSVHLALSTALKVARQLWNIVRANWSRREYARCTAKTFWADIVRSPPRCEGGGPNDS